MNKRVPLDAYRLQFSFTLHFTQRPIKESVMLKPPEMYKRVVGAQNIFLILTVLCAVTAARGVVVAVIVTLMTFRVTELVLKITPTKSVCIFKAVINKLWVVNNIQMAYKQFIKGN